MIRIFTIFLFALMVLVPISAQAKGKSSTSTQLKLSGYWNFQRNYTKSSDGSPIVKNVERNVISINQSGNKITIYFMAVDSSLYTFNGTRTGNTVKLTYSGQGGFVEKLTGKLSADKRSLSGTLDVDWGEPGNNGKSLHHYGTWTAFKQK